MPIKRSILAGLLVLLVCFASVQAEISRNQARKVIARMAGFNLPTSSVNVISVNSTANDSADASADLKLVFRLAQNEEGVWRISEIRTGQDLWEDVGVLALAANFTVPTPQCHMVKASGPRDTELNPKRIRCLVANMFGVTLPSDDVRVNDFSALSVPGATETSATAVVFLRANFRFRKDGRAWTVTEFKTGNRDWMSIANVPGAIDASKRDQAKKELRLIAFALEEYKKSRGSYIATDKHSVLIDHLSPRFLSTVTRLDPWHHPYRYQGDGQRYTLRSSGPDGKPDTADDITVSEGNVR